MNIPKIKQEVLNFINRVEHKLPEVMENAALFGIKYIDLAKGFLKSNGVIAFDTIVPAAEPYRAEIIAILEETEVAFKAVADAYKGTTLLTGASRIAALQVPGLDTNHYNAAVQYQYSKEIAKAA